MSSHTGGWSTPPRDAHLQLSPNTPTLPNLERTPLLQKSKHYLLKASHFRKGPLNDNFLGISWTCKPHVPPQSDWEWPRGVLSLFLTSFQTESSAWLSLRSSLSTQPRPCSHHSCPSNPQRHCFLPTTLWLASCPASTHGPRFKHSWKLSCPSSSTMTLSILSLKKSSYSPLQISLTHLSFQ